MVVKRLINSLKSLKVKVNKHIEAKLFIGHKFDDDAFIYIVQAYIPQLLMYAAQKLCIYTL